MKEPLTVLMEHSDREDVAFYVVGELVYRDAFNRNHFTKFRCKVIGDIFAGQGKLRPCLGGNEAN